MRELSPINALSKNVAVTGTIYTGACKFFGYVVLTDNTNDVTLTFRDNTSAIWGDLVPGTHKRGGVIFQGFFLPCSVNLNVVISVAGGGTCSVWVLYAVV